MKIPWQAARLIYQLGDIEERASRCTKIAEYSLVFSGFAGVAFLMAAALREIDVAIYTLISALGLLLIWKGLQVQSNHLYELAKETRWRLGFDPARLLKAFRALILSPNTRSDNVFARLADVLFLHGFLPSRETF